MATPEPYPSLVSDAPAGGVEIHPGQFVLILLVVYCVSWLLICAGQSLTEWLTRRSTVAELPGGGDDMPYGHPERDPLGLSDHEMAVLTDLDDNTQWERTR